MTPQNHFNHLTTFFKWVFGKIRKKGVLYWLTVLVLIGLGVWLGRWLENQEFAIDVRYKCFHALGATSYRKAFIQRTVVVLIGDEEYWKGELARRIPTKRDYLAKLIRHLDMADPAVIALDFDLRSQSPDGSYLLHSDYEAETKQLLDAVKEVSRNRWVVLPKTIRLSEKGYETESDIYDGYDFEGGKVRNGYISLPFDIRKVPLKQTMRNGSTVESFAEAIVRVTNEQALLPVQGLEVLPYGNYLASDAFTKISPTDVLNKTPESFAKLRHNIVIIGAGWSSKAYGRGSRVDIYPTPVGPLQGALIHANFVEALLDNRTSKPLGETILKIIEIIATFCVAVVFVLISRPLGKLIGIILLVVGLVAFSYFSWLNLGLFYDFFIPVLLVSFHAAYEQIHEWQTQAQA